MTTAQIVVLSVTLAAMAAVVGLFCAQMARQSEPIEQGQKQSRGGRRVLYAVAGPVVVVLSVAVLCLFMEVQ
ncbi:hypothetical protein [Ralstonia pseudosolanacearum]|uniref:Transmembrane protein n=1 Tax=Ralstonia phage RSY1 TaxID=1530085 RepID=A0A077KET1_9CAUD|nr:hypothetical protein [Ralstonia pseudosolanacearum]YP_009067121.1 hypothetical protein MA18_gp44 [Ralstonia phage RSY1]APC68770.1 hypothetical protein RSOE_17490 [Ralstonia solanacearum OE1-1]OIN71788.1 hypothetical protein BL247_13765 [Ralstonia solanacearum]API74502.1 hypothetical protein AC251_07975 [Ralstonia pseudosolanacearum]QKL92067.1 hypothetical protein HI802_08065 [Ralstonia solanacearum]QKL97142.1 hypothetical protein HI801_08065 [Ralstonia solanacearum]